MLGFRLNQLRYLKHPGQLWRVLFGRVKSIEVAILYACNKKCPGCYAANLRADQEKIFIRPRDIMDMCEKYKPAHINITGGEPMLSPYIFDIINLIDKSTVVSMVTNGDLIGIEQLELLKKCGLNTIQLSYGSNYNMNRNELVAKWSSCVGLNVCLSVTNIYKERENIKKALKICEENGYQLLFNTPGCGLEPEFDFPTYFTYRNNPVVREDNFFWAGNNVCPAGVQKFYITADKSIYPCDRMLHKKWNSYEEMREYFKKKRKVYCRRYEHICEQGEIK